jgi:hypothetical protein
MAKFHVDPERVTYTIRRLLYYTSLRALRRVREGKRGGGAITHMGGRADWEDGGNRIRKMGLTG